MPLNESSLNYSDREQTVLPWAWRGGEVLTAKAEGRSEVIDLLALLGYMHLARRIKWCT